MKKVLLCFLIFIFAISIFGCRKKSTLEKMADKIYDSIKQEDYKRGNMTRKEERELDRTYEEAKDIVKEIGSFFK